MALYKDIYIKGNGETRFREFHRIELLSEENLGGGRLLWKKTKGHAYIFIDFMHF